MSVEVTVDATVNDSIQDITIIVHDDRGNSDTIERVNDGVWDYRLDELPGHDDASYYVDIDSTSNAETTPAVNYVEIHISGDVDPVLSDEVPGEVEWSEHAIDGGEAAVSLDDYECELISVDGEGRRFEPTDISYAPAVNASKDLKLSVHPYDWLEGTDYLGAQLKVYANGDIIYIGEVKEIDANRIRDDYTLSTYSYGKRLLGKVIDQANQTGLAADVMAKLVDNASKVHSSYSEKANTADETLSNLVYDNGSWDSGLKVDPNTTSTSGTAEYAAIGDSAHDLNPLYVKAYTPDAIDITIDDGQNTHIETIQGFTDNEVGRWYVIEPDGLDDAWYDISFTINGEDSILHTWRAIENRKIKRVVEPPETSDAVTNADLYEYSSPRDSSGIEGTADIPNEVVEIAEGYRLRQKCTWNPILADDTNATTGIAGNAVDDAVWADNTVTSFQTLRKMSFRDKFPEWELHARIGLMTDNGAGETTFEVRVGGDTQTYTIDVSNMTAGGDFEWRKIAEPADNGGWSAELNESNEIRWRGTGNGDEVGFCSFVVIVGDTAAADLNFAYTFDNTLSAGGHLDSPKRYPSSYVEFEETPIDGSLTDATTTADITYQTDVQDQWGPIQTNDPQTWDTDSIPNSDTISEVIDGGHTHTTRVYLSSAGQRDTSTPRLGFRSQILSGIDVDGSHNDLARLYERDLDGNILSALNNIADNTTAMFRFEGDVMRIFELGQLRTTEDIRAESINSTASIEGVYESVEVIGLNGVTSGVIKAKETPDYVNDHKEIRDLDITNRRDAVARAQAFLEKQGTVTYKGEVETLPTFAPLGEIMDGSYFSHGQDMVITEVDYGKKSATIKLGFEQNVAQEFIQIHGSTRGSTEQFTK